ncbi:hypothetical protein [Kurthia sibirica]|uniref:Uncharacterized protein n=1 Tax=Kurthia sibirica TaxID=202750 RepID=A0A2U3ALJ8_9BACL|nr:hypothetical protein [Kurthia sibirica]PWI25398.1 hypothetical protein DEX24_08655 [Kurthia sibirica]GEK35638.1 hypothetical protein KSI01_31710 [Kurthia sibirica]
MLKLKEFHDFDIYDINYKLLSEKELLALLKDKEVEVDDDDEYHLVKDVKVGFSEDQDQGQIVGHINLIDLQYSRYMEMTISGYFSIEMDPSEDEEAASQQMYDEGWYVLKQQLRPIISFLTTMDSRKAVHLPLDF